MSEKFVCKKLSLSPKDTLVLSYYPPAEVERDVAEQLVGGFLGNIQGQVPCRVEVIRQESSSDVVMPFVQQRISDAEKEVASLVAELG